jgi:hypothetical protein
MPYQFQTHSDIDEVANWMIENIGKLIYVNSCNVPYEKRTIAGIGAGWRILPYGVGTGIHSIEIDDQKLYTFALLRWN